MDRVIALADGFQATAPTVMPKNRPGDVDFWSADGESGIGVGETQ
jgi:hypothetical protein